MNEMTQQPRDEVERVAIAVTSRRVVDAKPSMSTRTL
jgi:hypothetical protein